MAVIAFAGTKYENPKFRNAVGGDIATSIATVTAKLNEATQLYTQAMTAIAACNNSSIGCLDKTGRHISTWRDQRDRYAPLITQYKAELKELLEIQALTASSNTQSGQATQILAQAQTAIADAETAQTKSSAFKWLLIIGGVLLLVGGGVLIYKKLKK